jgi:hypothetical protein
MNLENILLNKKAGHIVYNSRIGKSMDRESIAAFQRLGVRTGVSL